MGSLLVQLLFLGLLHQLAEGRAQGWKAIVHMKPGSSPSIDGKLEISATRSEGITIKGFITGLTPGLHGFHIHTNPDLGNRCKDAGGHFNPFNHHHGDPRDLKRHIGDLGNIEVDEMGVANININDRQASLDPTSKAYIGNRSIVVHADPDDGGRGNNLESLKTGNAGARMGCGLIEMQQVQDQVKEETQPPPVASKIYPAKVTMVPGSNPNISGELTILPTEGGVIINGLIEGLTPGLHGFHVHGKGDLGNGCKNAGGHFNPTGATHGDPKDKIRHVGDLGNILADELGKSYVNIFDPNASLDPASEAYVGNLAIVVHADADDLGKGGNEESLKTGNAGARMGCGLIVIKSPPSEPDQQQPVEQEDEQQLREIVFPKEEPFQPTQATVVLVPGSTPELAGELLLTSQPDGVIIRGQITGLTPGLHGFHIHQNGDLGNECKNAGGHFNPLGANHGGPHDLERHVGDLGNIRADETGTANISIFDPMASMDPNSEAYIGSRAIVVHALPDDLGKGGDSESLKTGNAGARMGCGVIQIQQKYNLEQQQPQDQQYQEQPQEQQHQEQPLFQEPLNQEHHDPPQTEDQPQEESQQQPLDKQYQEQPLHRELPDQFLHEQPETREYQFREQSQPQEQPYEQPIQETNFTTFQSEENHQPIRAMVTLVPGSAPELAGNLIITSVEDGIHIEGQITGLTPGLHGFHIHQNGDLGNECKNAGPHFNPFGLNHGGPQDVQRHVGDLGNIEADEMGTANISIFDSMPTLNPFSRAYIGALAIVVHALPDDLGEGGDSDSLTTGNAGARMGCGIIEVEEGQQTQEDAEQYPRQPEQEHDQKLPQVQREQEQPQEYPQEQNPQEQLTPEQPTPEQIEEQPTPEQIEEHHTQEQQLEEQQTGEQQPGEQLEPRENQEQEQKYPMDEQTQPEEHHETDFELDVLNENITDQEQKQPSDQLYEESQQQNYTEQDQTEAPLDSSYQPTKATVLLVPGSTPDLAGELVLTSQLTGVTVEGQITGLTPGLHGFHIHQNGDLGNECKNAGGHFNPFGVNHGGPQDSERHVGDLGNIEADESGTATVSISDDMISLNPNSEAYVGSLAIVVHALPDDLGKGGDSDSLKTGNAGARMGCGVIEVEGQQLQENQEQPKENPSEQQLLGEQHQQQLPQEQLQQQGQQDPENKENVDQQLTLLEQQPEQERQTTLLEQHPEQEQQTTLLEELPDQEQQTTFLEQHPEQEKQTTLLERNPEQEQHTTLLEQHSEQEKHQTLLEQHSDHEQQPTLLVEQYTERERRTISQQRSEVEQQPLDFVASRHKRGVPTHNYFINFGAEPFDFSASDHFGGKGSEAEVVILPGTSKSVNGKLQVTEVHNGLLIKGVIYGLTPGLHGFHVHEKGDLGNKCQNAGPHFNPFKTPHGDLKDFHRHVGDLGNIKADSKGVAHIHIFDHQGSLDPHSQKFIGHRALVVHADPDDLGRGNNEESKKTGNSGARVGCGIVRIKSRVSGHDHIQQQFGQHPGQGYGQFQGHGQRFGQGQSLGHGQRHGHFVGYNQDHEGRPTHGEFQGQNSGHGQPYGHLFGPNLGFQGGHQPRQNQRKSPVQEAPIYRPTQRPQLNIGFDKVGSRYVKIGNPTFY